MTPKLSQKLKVRIEGTKENKSCSTTWVDPITVFEPYPNPNPKPKKVKNDLKIKSKSKFRIEINIENESCSTT